MRVRPADRVREGAEGDGEALPVRRQPSRGVDVERALRREERQDLHRPLHARRGRALLRVRPRDGDDAPHRGPHEAPRRARRGHQHERQDPRAHGRGQRRQRVLRLAQRGHRSRMHRPLQLQGRVLVPLLPEGRQGRGARQDQPPLRPAWHGDGPEVHAPLRSRGGRTPLHARHRGQVHARPRQGGRLGHLPHDLRRRRGQRVRLLPRGAHLEVRSAQGRGDRPPEHPPGVRQLRAAAHDVQADDRPEGP